MDYLVCQYHRVASCHIMASSAMPGLARTMPHHTNPCHAVSYEFRVMPCEDFGLSTPPKKKYWEAATPQTTCCSCGASSPPEPPCHPAQIMRGSASHTRRCDWVRTPHVQAANQAVAKAVVQQHQRFLDNKKCKLKAKLFYMAVVGVGCVPFKEAQKNACNCVKLEKRTEL